MKLFIATALVTSATAFTPAAKFGVRTTALNAEVVAEEKVCFFWITVFGHGIDFDEKTEEEKSKRNNVFDQCSILSKRI